ncbi:MAG: carboxypeptidase-like regulatory domain-containing protein [Fuerstiella sp.]
MRLNTGVYIHNLTWKKRLGMDLNFYSFDHGDWANWNYPVITDDRGRFNVSVPPPRARLWLRVGTTPLNFTAIMPPTGNDATTKKLARCVPFEYPIGGHSRSELLRVNALPPESDQRLPLGDLQLTKGVSVYGRVLDAAGNGLSGVHLTTTGAHGPHSGRKTISGKNGRFEFLAVASGSLAVHPDARLRDENGTVDSRAVQAVFAGQTFAIPETVLSHEITIRAVPHTEVVFSWIDRRADRTQPVAYYGSFRVRGYMPDANGEPSTYWTSNTERVERDGTSLLVVGIPTELLKPELILPADRKVTASYSDTTGTTSGPGVVPLGDLSRKVTHTIYGGEPKTRD